MTANIERVLAKLGWMREQGIWPNGLRYLWTDAFGVVLLVSLYRESGRPEFVEQAERLVADVEHVLGRGRGLRIGEAADRDGQYFHYLAMWMYALGCLGNVIREYRERAIKLVKDVHSAFVIPGEGVVWKMLEDLSAPYPGFGLGALDPFHGYTVYRQLGEEALAHEIKQMKAIVDQSCASLLITQEPGAWNDALDDSLLSAGAVGISATHEKPRGPQSNVDRPAWLFLPGTRRTKSQVCLYQLWCVAWPSIAALLAGAGRAPEFVFRGIPFRR